MSGENALSLVEGVRNDLGIAMVPLQRIKNDLKHGEFHVIKPTEKKLLNSILLIQHQNKIPTLAEKKFIEYIRENTKTFE